METPRRKGVAEVKQGASFGLDEMTFDRSPKSVFAHHLDSDRKNGVVPPQSPLLPWQQDDDAKLPAQPIRRANASGTSTVQVSTEWLASLPEPPRQGVLSGSAKVGSSTAAEALPARPPPAVPVPHPPPTIPPHYAPVLPPLPAFPAVSLSPYQLPASNDTEYVLDAAAHQLHGAGGGNSARCATHQMGLSAAAPYFAGGTFLTSRPLLTPRPPASIGAQSQQATPPPPRHRRSRSDGSMTDVEPPSASRVWAARQMRAPPGLQTTPSQSPPRAVMRPPGAGFILPYQTSGGLSSPPRMAARMSSPRAVGCAVVVMH